jgi:acetyl-CoA C-acetyltransferase/acetyl-CoA acyltransferase
MLTSGPAGAYLNEEINVASSPGHAFALAVMQILSGTHERLLVSSWGKASETAGISDQPAERLSVEPFYERDGGLSAIAAIAFQAQANRAGADAAKAQSAAAEVAAKNHGGAIDAGQVLASPLVAAPLRELECAPLTDAAYSIVVEAGGRAGVRAVAVDGIGWCSDSARIAERDLAGVPHLKRAADDAYGRAGVSDPAAEIGAWELHDYSPDAELVAYGAVGLCEPGERFDFALSGVTGPSGRSPVNRGGGSVRGEAPFGGPIAKIVNAVRHVQRGDADRAFAQIASGFAGQFQSAFVFGGAA